MNTETNSTTALRNSATVATMTLRSWLKAQGLSLITPVRESQSRPGVHVMFAYSKNADGSTNEASQRTLNFSKNLVTTGNVHRNMQLTGDQLDYFVVFESKNAEGQPRTYVGAPLVGGVVSIDDL